METPILRAGRRAIAACPQATRALRSKRCYATAQDDIRAAPPIRFNNNDANQFSRPRAEFIHDDDDAASPRRSRGGNNNHHPEIDYFRLLRHARIVPASPSYFTATPKYTDDLLAVSALLRRHELLPVLPPGTAPRVAWKSLLQYKTELAEPIRAKAYAALVKVLRRLNFIHPALMPAEVTAALAKFKRDVQPHLNRPKPLVVDQHGVVRAVGRRKSSRAIVALVEGEGEALINERSLSDYFGRVHDRESAVWALKATGRLDRYNVWALVKGGGTTGQAEAITLAVAKALLAHEPDLKPALRRAGVVTRDPRSVERKKPGKLKARKMPAWVKR